MSRYRRIVIDDSSSDDGINDDNDKILDETRHDTSENDKSSDISVQNISRLLETLSFTKRNTFGHRVDRTDDEATSIYEDTYLEDSFLVKDYPSSEGFKTAELSSFFRSDLSDASIDNNKVSTLFELYPELKENLNPERNQLSNNSIATCNEPTEFNVNSDDKFEKYLEEIKTQSSITNTYGSHDLDTFIMSDSESIIEYSSEHESNPSDKSSDDILKITETKRLDIIAFRKMLTVSIQYTGIIQQPKRQDDDEVFLLALSRNGPIHLDAQKYTAVKFPRIREELTAKLFNLYRKRCFKNKLDSNMVLEWNTRLRLTAGRCRCRGNGTACIELSIKVCNTPERLRDTLLHEMCHAAVWVIDHIYKGGHGPAWKYWVHQCQKIFPSLPLIERCHNYIIDAKYLYICNRCGQTIKRHSKSLDIDRKVCGICQGHFILRSREGKEFLTRPASTFAQFVKENYKKNKNLV
ncbi:Acidic repeat-containing protein [Dirofilaria immitis]|nr:Acidic repeat-containing protein [Dirofilaria immitis]